MGLLHRFRRPLRWSALSTRCRLARVSRTSPRSRSRRSRRLDNMMRHAPGSLQPHSTHVRGAKGVGEGHVISMGEEVLHGLWVPPHELVARLLELLEYVVEIFYCSHSDITSIDEVLSLDTLRAYYAIHRSAWKGYSPKFARDSGRWHHG